MMTAVLIAVLIVVVAVAAERARRDHWRRHHEGVAALLLARLAPAAARGEPQELLAWRDTADTVRALFPDAVGLIARRQGGRFPFAPGVVEAAHARWTAEWLAWERRHDAEFTERARRLDVEMQAAGDAGAAAGRARRAALDDEKLQTYQQRYEEYVRIGNGLTALQDAGAPSGRGVVDGVAADGGGTAARAAETR